MSSLQDLLTEQAGCGLVFTPDSFTVAQAKKSLQDNGLVVLREFISDASLDDAAKGLAEVIREDYLTEVPADLLPDMTEDPFSYDHFRSPGYGRGNASFGFLFSQPTTWDTRKLPKLALSEGDVYLQQMGAYVKGNLRLITHSDNQAAMAALFALTNPTGMVSFDSAKVCDYKTRPTNVGAKRIAPTKRTHTRAHFDLYPAGGINRAQAMIFGKQEGDVTLCFGRYTHRTAIQNEIAKTENNKDLFKRNGFVVVENPALLEALRKTDNLVVPQPGDMVIWRAGVLHVELDRNTQHVPQLRKVKNGRSLRFVVGTNNYVHVTKEDKEKLASAALQGLVPHPYIKSPGNAYDNVVCRKSTMYRKRPFHPLASAEVADIRLGDYPPRILHCLGLSKDVSDMYDDPRAIEITKMT